MVAVATPGGSSSSFPLLPLRPAFLATHRSATMAKPDAASLARLSAYAGLFRPDFRRADQARWAEVYLQGLLAEGSRKNVEALAAAVTLPPGLAAEDVAQALQNFISQSPWDESKLLRRYRGLVAAHVGASGLLVANEIAIPKKGRHSVGVQRQYSRSLGEKLNCQIVVALHLAGPTGSYPLAMRLYLPPSWLRSPERLRAAGVPVDLREPADRMQLALLLLDEVRAEGLQGRGVAGAAWLAESHAFREGLAERGWTCLTGTEEQQAEDACRRMKEKLGLGHFEGRSWRGFHHHACLVMLASAFTTLHSGSQTR